jgi:hypothetical protein
MWTTAAASLQAEFCPSLPGSASLRTLCAFCVRHRSPRSTYQPEMVVKVAHSEAEMQKILPLARIRCHYVSGRWDFALRPGLTDNVLLKINHTGRTWNFTIRVRSTYDDTFCHYMAERVSWCLAWRASSVSCSQASRQPRARWYR